MERSRQAGVERWLAVGGSPESNALVARSAHEHPGRILAAVGADRALADELEHAVEGLDATARDPGVVAIGETGLDYYYTPENAVRQRDLFARCLALAAEVCKPVIVHTRDADEDTCAALKEYLGWWRGNPSTPGVIHCFTRSREIATCFLDLGFYISFSGIVTFMNASDLRDTARWIPEDRLLVETDSPYLAPVPHRGQRCEPAMLTATAQRLADLRGCTVEHLASVTSANADCLFGVPHHARERD